MLSDVYAQILEQRPNLILSSLKKWNASKNSWKRRQSIVSLFYYYRFREKVPSFNQSVQLIETLMFDQNYYVQKGLGWTLRELYQAYPTKTFTFFKKHSKNISPIAFSAASEKLGQTQKTLLKKKRNA